MVYEIELKALLTKEQYHGLLDRLTNEFKLINEDTIHTTRYRPGDIRFRYSPKICEIVQKEGDPTMICRKETREDVNDRDELRRREEALKAQDYKPDPPWIKHKKEFLYPYNGFDYVVCLQDIENFAYILEVEFMSNTPDLKTHEPNIRAVTKELSLEPIEPVEFLRMIQEYIETNR